MADWNQETLPPGATLVLIIGMSDQTHLTNLSGDKQAWHVYIMLGYLPSGRHNSPHPWQFSFLHYCPWPITIKVLQSRSTPEINQRWHPTGRIRTDICTSTRFRTWRLTNWLHRWEASEVLPNLGCVHGGPHGKRFAARNKIQPLS